MEEEDDWNTGPSIEDIISSVMKSKSKNLFGSRLSRLSKSSIRRETTIDGVRQRSEEPRTLSTISGGSREAEGLGKDQHPREHTREYPYQDRVPLSASKLKKHSTSTPELRSKFMDPSNYNAESKASRRVDFSKYSLSSNSLINKENARPNIDRDREDRERDRGDRERDKGDIGAHSRDRNSSASGSRDMREIGASYKSERDFVETRYSENKSNTAEKELKASQRDPVFRVPISRESEYASHTKRQALEPRRISPPNQDNDGNKGSIRSESGQRNVFGKPPMYGGLNQEKTAEFKYWSDKTTEIVPRNTDYKDYNTDRHKLTDHRQTDRPTTDRYKTEMQTDRQHTTEKQYYRDRQTDRHRTEAHRQTEMQMDRHRTESQTDKHKMGQKQADIRPLEPIFTRVAPSGSSFRNPATTVTQPQLFTMDDAPKSPELSSTVKMWLENTNTLTGPHATQEKLDSSHSKTLTQHSASLTGPHFRALGNSQIRGVSEIPKQYHSSKPSHGGNTVQKMGLEKNTAQNTAPHSSTAQKIAQQNSAVQNSAPHSSSTAQRISPQNSAVQNSGPHSSTAQNTVPHSNTAPNTGPQNSAVQHAVPHSSTAQNTGPQNAVPHSSTAQNSARQRNTKMAAKNMFATPQTPMGRSHPLPPTPPSTHKLNQRDNLMVNGKAYLKLQLLGRGGSCKVYEAVELDSRIVVAVKVVDLEGVDEATCAQYKNEIAYLKKLQWSPRVIKLLDYEERGNILSLVMEKGNGDLASVISSIRGKRGTATSDITPFTIQHYWHGMLLAVQAIHEEGIIHSDLKPANFLLVNYQVKLIDFGIASSIQQDMTSVLKDSQAGTFNYMSPESLRDVHKGPIINNQGSAVTIKISVKSDVWSLGCILYNLVYGYTPFQHIGNPLEKLRAISSESTHISFPEIDDKELMDVLKRCLRFNPYERPSIEELLAHPYLTVAKREHCDKGDGSVERHLGGEQTKDSEGSKVKSAIDPKLRLMMDQLSHLSPNSLKKISLHDLLEMQKDGKKV